VQPASTTPVIVCFGDSLTAGYQSPQPFQSHAPETPYGLVLQERLGSRARVEVSGVCGEVTGEMVLRYRATVLARRPTVVILLGGTNDLGWNAEPAEIMRNLIKLYEQARAASIVPVPVTVPSIRIEADARQLEVRSWLDEHIQRRRRLNGLIADYATAKGLPWFDLFTETAEPGSLLLAAPYSNDGLHLSTSGYRLFGNRLYEQHFSSDRLIPFLSPDEPSHP